MRRLILVGCLLAAAGCATPSFHEGRTALRKEEQGCLVARKGTPKGVFDRFCTSTRPVSLGLVQWQEDQSWACPQAPADLLQSIRDELGRLNQRYRVGENASLTVTVYRFDRGGAWSRPTAHYEIVARNSRGQVIWAADDQIEAAANLARSLSDTPSTMIGREILRRVRQQLGI